MFLHGDIGPEEEEALGLKEKAGVEASQSFRTAVPEVPGDTEHQGFRALVVRSAIQDPDPDPDLAHKPLGPSPGGCNLVGLPWQE